MNSDIDDLIVGYKNFREHYHEEQKVLFDELVQYGQSPRYLIIACCDSRVDPAIIFRTKPGDLFVIRNVANLIPPFSNDSGVHGVSAALEFAIEVLGVKHIIVLGHSQCGGIRALLERKTTWKTLPFVSAWMSVATDAGDKTHQHCNQQSIEQQTNYCAKLSLEHSIENLLSFPWIAEKVQQKQLDLHAWFFDLTNGELLIFNEKNHEFEKIT